MAVPVALFAEGQQGCGLRSPSSFLVISTACGAISESLGFDFRIDGLAPSQEPQPF